MLSANSTSVQPLDSGVLLGKPELVLGRYRLMSTNETGGFGNVLTCWDTRLQRRVAIKRIPLVNSYDTSGSASTISEALTEARTASLLAHPNIVSVYDFEYDSSWAYLVMEFVDCLTLSDLLMRVEGGTLTGDECAYVACCIADALSFAHENGVLHLDIKPSNILFDHAGNVKICDFGMATLASATGYGDARGGTVGYMSPEQIRGDMVDERSDIFSLAVLVWQALTGSNPFEADTAEHSLMLIERGPSISQLKRFLDPNCVSGRALLHALSPNPAMRPSTIIEFASEVAYDLGNVADGHDSIQNLLLQATPQDKVEETWEGEGLPTYFRYPWARPLIERLTAGVSSAFSSLLCLNFLYLANSTVWISVCTIFLAAVLFPPLGSLLLIISMSISLLAYSTVLEGILLSLTACIPLAIWWIHIGVREHSSTPALAIPCCIGIPTAGAGWAAAFLKPLHALVTSLVSWTLGMTFYISLHMGFTASAVNSELLWMFSLKSTWISLASSGLAAFIGSLITNARKSTTCAALGQIACAAIIIGGQLLAGQMEKGDIWLPPSQSTILIAVVLCVLVSIATFLSGPSPEDPEEEDHERN